MSDEYRTLIDTTAGSGMRLEVWQFHRKSHGFVDLGSENAMVVGGGDKSVTLRLRHAVGVPMVWRQVRIVLEGGSALLEPGALQYAVGNLAVEVQKHDKRSNMLTRALASAATGESGFATRYQGQGEVWTEPTRQYFIGASMDGPQDALLLDDKAFYACEGSVAVSTHIHSSVQGLFSGNGFAQPRLEGRGAFLIESPVPAHEIEQIDLDGQRELIVDGDLMLMYSAALNVTLQPLVRGLRNLYRSGEGLVYRIRGKGSVWITPTKSIGH